MSYSRHRSMLKPRLTVFGRMVETLEMNMIIEKTVEIV
jgi:hypothetical protein